MIAITNFQKEYKGANTLKKEMREIITKFEMIDMQKLKQFNIELTQANIAPMMDKQKLRHSYTRAVKQHVVYCTPTQTQRGYSPC